MTETAMPEAPMDESSPSLIQKMIGIFYSPRSTYESITKSVTWQDLAVPFLLALIIGMIAQYFITPIALAEQREALMQNTQLSQEQIDTALSQMDSMGARMQGGLGYIIAIVTSLLYTVVLTGLLMFIGSFILGGESTFKITLGVMIFAGLIGIPELLVKTPLMVQAQSVNVKTGFDVLLPGSMAGTLVGRFFHSLDFFRIWQIYVLGIGVALAYGVDEKRTHIILYGIWAIVMFLIAWLFGGIGA